MNQAIPVVLDTNVLVSAFWSADGTPSKIVHLIPSGILLPCYSDEILNEYKEVLSRPAFNFTSAQVDELVKKYEKFGKAISLVSSNISFHDESDRKFYDVAKACNALLITGNIRHYPQEKFIMPPLSFYRYILGRQD